MTSEVRKCLDVLRKDLMRTAPEYFNTDTLRGRAALLAALTLAAGEFTKGSASVPPYPNKLYTHMGGSGGNMMGWAQLNTNYFNDEYPYYDPNYLTSESFVYNKKIGRILYGIDELPLGKGQKFKNLVDFAKSLEKGEFRNAGEILGYLQRYIPAISWPGLHDSFAVHCILNGGFIENSYREIYGHQLASSMTISRRSGKLANFMEQSNSLILSMLTPSQAAPDIPEEINTQPRTQMATKEYHLELD